jgi:hypothetical protein
VSPLWMGIVRPGEAVTRNLVVHGREPFVCGKYDWRER